MSHCETLFLVKQYEDLESENIDGDDVIKSNRECSDAPAELTGNRLA